MKQPTTVEKVEEVAKQITKDALDNAAALLLAQLPDQCGELVTNLRDEYAIPLWQLFCGILLAMHLEGRLSAFQLDPAWQDGLRQHDLLCGWCKTSFTPRWIAQKYCSEKCGVAANEAEREKSKPNDAFKTKLATLAQSQKQERLLTDDPGTTIGLDDSTIDGIPSFINDSWNTGIPTDTPPLA